MLNSSPGVATHGSTASIAHPRRGRNKSERVYQELREGITSGAYSPGYRLVLSRLADTYAVSTVPVREAVRRLEAEGLVSHTPNVGFEVTGVDPRSYSDAMQTLAVLQACCTALAAPHVTPEVLDRAQAVNDEMRRIREYGDAEAFTEANSRFHLILCSTCPNSRMREMVEREVAHLSQIRRSTFAFVPERALTSVDEHDAILDMIREGRDQAQIEDAVRAHTMRTMHMFLDRERSHGDGREA